eukprot:6140568-Pleurochrysis_carterae.AAC.1
MAAPPGAPKTQWQHRQRLWSQHLCMVSSASSVIALLSDRASEAAAHQSVSEYGAAPIAAKETPRPAAARGGGWKATASCVPIGLVNWGDKKLDQ